MAAYQGGSNRNKNYTREVSRDFETEFLDEWITSSIKKEAIKYAEDFGKFLAGNGLSSSQIRKAYNEVRRIHSKKDFPLVEFLLITPKLAYTAKKKGTNNEAMYSFKNVMQKAHSLVDTDKIESENEENRKIGFKQFQNFCDFFEALVAYHKVYSKD